MGSASHWPACWCTPMLETCGRATPMCLAAAACVSPSASSRAFSRTAIDHAVAPRRGRFKSANTLPEPKSWAEGGGKNQYPIFGRTTGRIAALLLACVARHTALRAPCTASRQRTQKRHFGYFRLPYLTDILARLPTWPSSRLAELLPHRWLAPSAATA